MLLDLLILWIWPCSGCLLLAKLHISLLYLWHLCRVLLCSGCVPNDNLGILLTDMFFSLDITLVQLPAHNMAAHWLLLVSRYHYTPAACRARSQNAPTACWARSQNAQTAFRSIFRYTSAAHCLGSRSRRAPGSVWRTCCSRSSSPWGPPGWSWGSRPARPSCPCNRSELSHENGTLSRNSLYNKWLLIQSRVLIALKCSFMANLYLHCTFTLLA